jgi:type II restriction enzyme
MYLAMPGELAAPYKSPAQRARVVTEGWGEENLYCANCSSPRLLRTTANVQAVDFTCPECEHPFQLKSQSRPFSARIVDAAYSAMRDAIQEGRTPSLLALHYDPLRWSVLDLILLPRFVFTLSCLERRKPLGSGARRHGWVGCNIVLTSIPPDARIPVVSNGHVARVSEVRERFARLRPLEDLRHEARGWTLDVLNVLRGMGRKEFTLAEVYAFEGELARLHPDNRNIRPKIRQQLQILRDMGFIQFHGRGVYRVS